MSSLFLDPKRPLSTCSSTDCQDCPVRDHLQCHFCGKDLVQFLFIALPPFIVGGMGIVHLNGWYLVPWFVLCLSYFGFVEIRVMCSHCPHYAEPGTKSLQCWANYGSPKLWKYRPGPMSAGEKRVFFVGLVLIAGYPLAFLVLGMQWLLLALFLVLVVVMGAAMHTLMCKHCMNFACPLNNVDQKIRADFFKRNPVVARAWSRTNK
ncbi:MAG: hypothetical protein JW730_19465 [Anaerolineales bacterium]|nr:hypothetical protein [Anaerolineales bacterium]